jgi:hypothetical protein
VTQYWRLFSEERATAGHSPKVSESTRTSTATEDLAVEHVDQLALLVRVLEVQALKTPRREKERLSCAKRVARPAT